MRCNQEQHKRIFRRNSLSFCLGYWKGDYKYSSRTQRQDESCAWINQWMACLWETSPKSKDGMVCQEGQCILCVAHSRWDSPPPGHWPSFLWGVMGQNGFIPSSKSWPLFYGKRPQLLQLMTPPMQPTKSRDSIQSQLVFIFDTNSICQGMAGASFGDIIILQAVLIEGTMFKINGIALCQF